MAKIKPHVFHGFYTFDYFKPELKNGAPQLLYADWPIIDRVPMGAIFEGESKLKKFSSEFEIRKWIENDNSIEERDFCKNYFLVNSSNISKYRELFHRMTKSLNIRSRANLKLTGNSSGPSKRTCCRAVGITLRAVYESGGHCCDDAEFNLYCKERFIGYINLNNSSDCGARTAGPFYLSKGDVEFFREDNAIPLTIEAAKSGRIHSDFTDIEITNTETGDLITRVSLGLGTTLVEVCYQPENDFSEEFCCCPPKVKVKGPDGKGRSENATGYSCDRTHNLDINIDINQNTAAIFGLSNLQTRLPAADRGTLERYIAKFQPQEDIEEDREFFDIDTLTFNEKQVYKEKWVFDNEKLKELIPSSEKFPKNSTLINDPILPKEWAGGKCESEDDDTNDDSSGGVLSFDLISLMPLGLSSLKTNYVLQAGSSNDKDKDCYSFNKILLENQIPDHPLTAQNNLTSDKLGSYSLNINSNNVYASGNFFPKDTGINLYKYYNHFGIQQIAYLPEKKDYVFFVNYNNRIIVPNDIYLTWAAGNYSGINHSKLKPNMFDLVKIEDCIKEEQDFKFLKHIRQTTRKENFESLLEEVSEEEALQKKEITIKFTNSSTPDAKVEVFEVKKTKIDLENPDEEPDKEQQCLRVDAEMNWRFEVSEIKFNRWEDTDFSANASFPPKL